MNIFDWHENKTPEELATELGILDLSVVKNAGKETCNNLKIIEAKKKDRKNNKDTNSPINPFLWLSQSDIDNDNKWEVATDWNLLKLGMRVKNVIVWKILSIDKYSLEYMKILIWFGQGSIKVIDTKKDSIDDILVYTEDSKTKIRLWDSILSSESSWVSISEIEDLERNMRVRKIKSGDSKYLPNDESWYIADINIKKAIIKVKINNSIENYKFIDFYKNFDIYTEDFEPVKIRKLGYEGKWISNYSFEDIEKNMYIAEKNKLYKIKKIRGNIIEIRNFTNTDTFYWSTITYVTNFSDMKKKYKILKKSEEDLSEVNDFMGLSEIQLKTESIWEGKFDESELKLGMRVKKYDNKYGKIITLAWNNISIKFIDASMEDFDTFDQFKMVYDVYYEDLERYN